MPPVLRSDALVELIAPRRVSRAPALAGMLLGLLSLLGWLPGLTALLLTVAGFHAPLPTRSLLMLMNGASLLLLQAQRHAHARHVAVTSLAMSFVLLCTTLANVPLPPDAWALARGLEGVLPPGALTLLQGGVNTLVPVGVLLLTQRRPSEVRLLVVTGMGMALVGGAILLGITHATRVTATAGAFSGPLSLAGIGSTLAYGVALFVIVSSHQAIPRVPPRWSPEMAGLLALLCTLVLTQALHARATLPNGQAESLPTVVLLLGLIVSALTYVALRLLRSNWRQAHQLAHLHLSSAFETASDGVWDYDFVERRVRRSVSQLRHLGYDEGTINEVPGAWLALVHPDDRERVAYHESVRRGATDAHGEITYRVRAHDGAWHTIVDRGRVVERLPDGRPRLILGISADITERLAADRARLRSERRFRAMFDSAMQGQILTDASGVCLEVNATAMAIVGAHKRDVLGLPIAAGPWFTGLSDAQQCIGAQFLRAAHGEQVRFEVETHLLDGRVGLLECSMTPLRTEGNDVQQVLCEMQDVTARRRSDEALREIGALTTMGRLAARVAHEINNPLAGIQNAFLLLADAVPETHPHRRFLQSIEREIQRIASVTRSLYETYRSDGPPGASGSMALAVNDAVTFLDQVNRSRNVRIVTDLSQAPTLVPVPDALLRQTLYNLVQNAVEASPTGGTVALTVVADAKECVITVRDEGVRIPDHLRERIFEPFAGARSAAMRTGSMGIGLSLVKQSVHALGGAVRLLDAPGHGATFEVRLPMTSVVVATSTRATPTQRVAAG